jgi:excisionase family DNA binding protein
MAASEEQLLSLEDVASRLQVSDQTVRRWIKSGKLAAYKPGLEWRIKPSDLEEFLQARSSPKAPRRSPFEPSLLNGLEEERRLRYLRTLRAFVWKLVHRWEKEPPKTSAEVSPLFEAMNAMLEQGVFEPSDAGFAEGTELATLMNGFEKLNDIADKVEQDEEAEKRRAKFRALQGERSA